MDNRASATSVQGLGDCTAEDEHEDLLAPRRQVRPSPESLFPYATPFDGAQDMLCAFAGNSSSALASLAGCPCGEYSFTVNPEQLLF